MKHQHETPETWMLVLILPGNSWATLVGPFPVWPPYASVSSVEWDWEISKAPGCTLVFDEGKTYSFCVLMEKITLPI